MRAFGLVWGLVLAFSAAAPAQVTVELTQEQQQFLQGEAIPVAVRITNRSGQSLHLGEEEDWLTFTIETREGAPVPSTGNVPVQGAFELESSHMATKRADLAPHFSPMLPGHYGITATVFIKDWNRQIASPVKYFDIVEGAKLWEQEFGIPVEPGSTATPEVRKYILQQANYLKGQIRLYLRVTDSYGKTYRVFPIGQVISFGRPEAQVDKFSHLHVLYQNGPGQFSYTVYDHDGMLLARQTYDYQGSRPKLRSDEDSVIYVFGGVRRYSSTDVPQSPEEDAIKPATATRTNDVPPPYNPAEKTDKPKKKGSKSG
jgi:hypothetical protein